MEVAVSVLTSGVLVLCLNKWLVSVSFLQLLFFSLLPCVVSVYLIQHRVLAAPIHGFCARKGAFYVQFAPKALVDRLRTARTEFLRAYTNEKNALKRCMSERGSSAALSAASSNNVMGHPHGSGMRDSRVAMAGSTRSSTRKLPPIAQKTSSNSLKTSFGSFSTGSSDQNAALVAGNGKSLYNNVKHQLCDHEVVDYDAPVYFYDVPSRSFLKVNKQRKLVLTKDFSASCLFHLGRGKTHHWALFSSMYQCYVGQNIMQRVVVQSKKLSNWESFRLLQRRVEEPGVGSKCSTSTTTTDVASTPRTPTPPSSPAKGGGSASASSSMATKGSSPAKSVASTSSSSTSSSAPLGPLKPIQEETNSNASTSAAPSQPPSPSPSDTKGKLRGPVIHLILCSARFGKGMWLARDPITNVIYFSKNYTKALCLQYDCDLTAIKSLTADHHRTSSRASEAGHASSTTIPPAPVSAPSSLSSTKPSSSSNPPPVIGVTFSAPVVQPPPSRKASDPSRSSSNSPVVYTKHLQLGIDFHQPLLTSMEVPRLILPWVAVSDTGGVNYGRLRGLSITSKPGSKPPVRFFDLSEKELKQVSCKSFMDVSCREVMNFFMDASTRQRLRAFTNDAALSESASIPPTDALFPTLTPAVTEPGAASEWHWFAPMNSFFRKLTCRVPAHGVSFRHPSPSTDLSRPKGRSDERDLSEAESPSFIGTELAKSTCMDIYHGVKFYPVKRRSSSSAFAQATTAASAPEEDIFHLAIFKSKLFNLGVPFSNSFSIETSFEFSDFRSEQEEGSFVEEEEEEKLDEEDPNRRLGLQVRCCYGVIYSREVSNSLRITIEKQVHQGVVRACDKLFELLDQAQKKKRSVVSNVSNLDSFLFQLLPPHSIDMEILAGMVHAIPNIGTQGSSAGSRQRSSSRSSNDGANSCVSMWPSSSLKLTWEPFASKEASPSGPTSASDSEPQSPVLLLENARKQFQVVFEKDLQFAPAFASLVTGLGSSQMTLTPQFVFDVLFSDSSVFENPMGMETSRSSLSAVGNASNGQPCLPPYGDICAWTSVVGGDGSHQEVFMRQQQLDMHFDFEENKLLKKKPVVSICSMEFFGFESSLLPSSSSSSVLPSSEGAFEFGMKLFMDLHDFVSPTGMMVEAAETTADVGTTTTTTSSRTSSSDVKNRFSVEILVSVGDLGPTNASAPSGRNSSTASASCDLRCMVAPAIAVSGDKSQRVPFRNQINEAVQKAVQELGKVWTTAFCQAFPYPKEQDNKLLLYRDHKIPSHDEIVRRIAGAIVDAIAATI